MFEKIKEAVKKIVKKETKNEVKKASWSQEGFAMMDYYSELVYGKREA